MQTFLPYAEFSKIADVLDYQRCWKQVVECKQVICNLHAENLPLDWVESRSYINQGWRNHPAVKIERTSNITRRYQGLRVLPRMILTDLRNTYAHTLTY